MPLVTEATPVAFRAALTPLVPGPNLSQPLPPPTGGLLHGHATTPPWPGRQKSVPTAWPQAGIPSRQAAYKYRVRPARLPTEAMHLCTNPFGGVLSSLLTERFLSSVGLSEGSHTARDCGAMRSTQELGPREGKSCTPTRLGAIRSD